MAANTSPIFTDTPKAAWATITAANTAKDGTGTTSTLVTAGADGALISGVRAQPLGTNTASVLRLFLNNGLTSATPANNTLIAEASLPATTLSEVAGQSPVVVPLNIQVPAGYKLLAAIGTTGATFVYGVSGGHWHDSCCRLGNRWSQLGLLIMLIPTGLNGVPQRLSPVRLVVQEVSDGSRPLAAEDIHCYRKFTTGTFTQAIDPVASLGEGWIAWVGNQGTGDVTLEPANNDLLDGLTNFICYPEEIRCLYTVLQNNVLVLESFVVNSFVRTYTANGNFTKPPGYYAFEGLLWGGGGSGSKSAGGGGAGPKGGGGGACVPFAIAAASFGAVEVVTIAASVLGPSASGNGLAGNNSTLGALVTAYGGGAALTASGAAGGGGGGSMGASAAGVGGAPAGGTTGATGGDSSYGGGGGGNAGPGGKSFYGGGGGGGLGAQAGGASMYGGGGGGGATGPGGASSFGGRGGQGNSAVSAEDGVAPGGGGGGTDTGTKAGDGARGQLRITGKF